MTCTLAAQSISALTQLRADGFLRKESGFDRGKWFFLCFGFLEINRDAKVAFARVSLSLNSPAWAD